MSDLFPLFVKTFNYETVNYYHYLCICLFLWQR